jgi:hypothetical protein
MAGTGSTIREMIMFETEIDVDLASDNTLNDDAYLSCPMAANEELAFEVYAHYLAGAGGIQCAMNGPAGFTHLHYSANLDVSGAVKVSSNIAEAYQVTVTDGAGQGMTRIIGMVHNGATPGNLVFQWAQNVSNPANTTIHQDSWMRITRIDG